MKTTKPLVSKSFKKITLLVFILFTCLLAFGQNNQIKDVILVDATQLKNKDKIAQPVLFNKKANEWTIEPNQHDVFIFKVIKEIKLEDIPRGYQILPLDSFIDDSVSRYEKLNGKKPEPPYFGATHIETMIYKNLYLKVKDTEERYYKVSIRYEWKIA